MNRILTGLDIPKRNHHDGRASSSLFARSRFGRPSSTTKTDALLRRAVKCACLLPKQKALKLWELNKSIINYSVRKAVYLQSGKKLECKMTRVSFKTEKQGTHTNRMAVYFTGRFIRIFSTFTLYYLFIYFTAPI